MIVQRVQEVVIYLMANKLLNSGILCPPVVSRISTSMINHSLIHSSSTLPNRPKGSPQGQNGIGTSSPNKPLTKMSFGFESSKWSMFQRTLPLNGLIRHKPALIRSHPQAITPKTMASNDRVRQEIAAFRQSLLDEGSLGDMFINLEDLEKHGNPNFVQEIMTNYFRDSTKYMDNVEQLLNETTVNFMEVSRLAYKLNRSTGFVGAHKVSYPASQLKEHAYSGNLDGCRASLQLVKREHAELRGKIETYFQMMRRAGPVETAERPVSRAADNA